MTTFSLRKLLTLTLSTSILFSIPITPRAEAEGTQNAPAITECPKILLGGPFPTLVRQIVESDPSESGILSVLVSGGLISSRLFREAVASVLADHGVVTPISNSFKSHRLYVKNLMRFVTNLNSGDSKAKLFDFMVNVLNKERFIANQNMFKASPASVVRGHQVALLVNTLIQKGDQPAFRQTYIDVAENAVASFALSAATDLTRVLDKTKNTTSRAILKIASTLAGGSLLGAIWGHFHGGGTNAARDASTGLMLGAYGFMAYAARRTFNRYYSVSGYNVNAVMLRHKAQARVREIAQLSNDDFEHLEKALDDLGEVTMTMLGSNACKTAKTCELAPIQLAYLGEVESVEINGWINRLKQISSYERIRSNNNTVGVFKNGSFTFSESFINNLRAVEYDTENSIAQSNLVTSIRSTHKVAIQSEKTMTALLGLLSRRIKTIRTAVKIFRRQVGAAGPDRLTQNLRYQILQSRLDQVLTEISKIKLERPIYRTAMDRREQIAKLTANWLRDIPSDSPAGVISEAEITWQWRAFAKKVRKDIEHINKFDMEFNPSTANASGLNVVHRPLGRVSASMR